NDTIRLNFDPITGIGQTLLEAADTNSIRNPRAEGAVVGTATLPTNWTVATTAGLSRQVVAVGTEDGIPFCDVRYFGTSNATLVHTIFESQTGIPAVPGQQWTGSCYVRLIAGSVAPATATCLLIYLNNSAGTAIVTGGST